MICKKCGAEINSNLKFCNKCGAKVVLEETSNIQEQPPVEPPKAVNTVANEVKEASITNVVEETTEIATEKTIETGKVVEAPPVVPVAAKTEVPKTETPKELTKKETIPLKPKNKTVAGLLAIFLGFFGIHWFYLGKPIRAIIYIAVYIFFPFIWIAYIIEGIYFLCAKQESFDNYRSKF